MTVLKRKRGEEVHAIIRYVCGFLGNSGLPRAAVPNSERVAVQALLLAVLESYIPSSNATLGYNIIIAFAANS